MNTRFMWALIGLIIIFGLCNMGDGQDDTWDSALEIGLEPFYGPYVISLDTGIPNGLFGDKEVNQIWKMDPISSETMSGVNYTEYGFIIAKRNDGPDLAVRAYANIEVHIYKYEKEFKDGKVYNAAYSLVLDDLHSISIDKKVDMATRKVDGRDAIIGKTQRKDTLMYEAAYGLDNSTIVTIDSIYQWDDLKNNEGSTLRVMKTINVTCI